MHTLGYADDLALTDNGNAADTTRAIARATEIAVGSRTAADMKAKIVKTKVLRIRWKNYQEEDDDTWEARSNIHPAAIKEFEIENSLYA